jgi:methyl-accepting chemotaxis protein/PAS domain-containing protein
MPEALSPFVVRYGWLLIIAAGIVSLIVGLAIPPAALAGALPAGAAAAALATLIGLAAAGAFVIVSLRRHIRLLNAALDGMPQGVCMFDAAARLMVCNERYLEIYRLTAEQAKPGRSLRDLLESCRGTGTFFGNAERFAAECKAKIAEGKSTSTAWEMKDGRIVAFSTRPRSDGGWVDTHEDISERRRAALQRNSVQQHQQRRLVLEEAIQSFRQQTENLLKSTTDSVKAMRTMASALLGVSGQTSQNAARGAEMSRGATASVEMAAAAAMQLSASISEISRRLARTTEIVRNAANETQHANDQITSLASAAQKIGDVVSLIGDIARQTNLLALNATIEAARAGEAGKGFTVVASEVKSLAAQTAKATDNVAAQIASVQQSTDAAVAAIGRIAERMQEVNADAFSVAGSVEQQAAATEEISRNVASAASGTKMAVSALDEVAGASHEARASAEALLQSSEVVASVAANLRGAVETFLSKVAV